MCSNFTVLLMVKIKNLFFIILTNYILYTNFNYFAYVSTTIILNLVAYRSMELSPIFAVFDDMTCHNIFSIESMLHSSTAPLHKSYTYRRQKCPAVNLFIRKLLLDTSML
jgi:hypothetical protein